MARITIGDRPLSGNRIQITERAEVLIDRSDRKAAPEAGRRPSRQCCRHGRGARASPAATSAATWTGGTNGSAAPSQRSSTREYQRHMRGGRRQRPRWAQASRPIGEREGNCRWRATQRRHRAFGLAWTRCCPSLWQSTAQTAHQRQWWARGRSPGIIGSRMPGYVRSHAIRGGPAVVNGPMP